MLLLSFGSRTVVNGTILKSGGVAISSERPLSLLLQQRRPITSHLVDCCCSCRFRCIPFIINPATKTQQHRTFGTSSFSKFSYKDNPFKILGIPSDSSFDHVKQTFVQLALKKHPDVEGGSADDFMKLRTAFESIVQAEKDKPGINKNRQGGRNSRSSNNSGGLEEEEDFDPNDWQTWFRRRTGMDVAFDMTESTLREMIHSYKTMAQGGKDKGGYWDLARQMAEHEDIFDRKTSKRKNKSTFLLSTSSTTSSTSTTTSSLNRRRRKR